MEKLQENALFATICLNSYAVEALVKGLSQIITFYLFIDPASWCEREQNTKMETGLLLSTDIPSLLTLHSYAIFSSQPLCHY